MRIAVFGATGKLGRLVVEQGLAQGHVVTAFVRNPAAVAIQHERLTVIQGDARDVTRVEAAVAGQEAVVSALGVRVGQPIGTFYTDSYRTLVTAMRAFGVRRLVCVSAWMVRENRRHIGLLARLLAPFVFREYYPELESREQIVRESSLDWIIVRPAILGDRPARGIYRSGPHIRMRLVPGIARADVAAFLLGQVCDNTYLHQAVSVSY
jgi:putative NADH-flavin reductase